MLNAMDPEQIRALLEGQEDILTPAIKLEEKFYQHLECPMCQQSGCEKRIRAPRVITDDDGNVEVLNSPFVGDILPEGYAHCPNCETDFNPYTGVIYSTEASMIHGPK